MRTLFIPIFFFLTLGSVRSQTVWDLIANDPDLDTLETALLAAQLDGRLNDTVPLTVFAPTDSAFANLPAGVLDAWLLDTVKLGPLLRNHLVDDSLSAMQLATKSMVLSLAGQELSIKMDSTGMYINQARIIIKDLRGSNGIVHVINAVLQLPADTTTVRDVIAGNAQTTVLDSLITLAGLDMSLDGMGPITCFAPTDAAFASLSPRVWSFITDSAGYLQSLLDLHLVSDSLPSTELTDGLQLNSWQGATLEVAVDSLGITINGSRIMMTDLTANNGVIHLLEAVLELPAVDTMVEPVTIVDVVGRNAQYSLLDSALTASGLDAELAMPGPYTLFAPTDAAFSALSSTMLDSLFADPNGSLKDLLRHHVVSGQLPSASLLDGQTLTTLAGDALQVLVDSSGIHIDGALIIAMDSMASNGVVHGIDAVLIPEVVEQDTTTVWDLIAGRTELSSLTQELQLAGLDNDLENAGPFTVFAPTDAAFAALLPGVLDSLNADPTGDLANVLLYHIVAGTYGTTDFVNGFLSTRQGGLLQIQISGSMVLINDVALTVTDLVATNGVVHVLDAVLFPPKADTRVTLVDMLENSPMHQTLLEEINLAGLNTILDGDGPFTLFAPNDSAFAHLPTGFLDSLNADPEQKLYDFLAYHVVDGAWNTNTLKDGQKLVALSGDTLYVTRTDTGIYINQSLISMANIQTDNGLLHYLDGVLMAPVADTTTILGLIRERPELLILNQLIDSAGLAGSLTGASKLTVFAPTDAAFAALSSGALDSLMQQPEVLSQLLRYHATAGLHPASSLMDGDLLTSLEGDALSITRVDSNIWVNDAKIIMTDLTAGNGIVHLIDVVLRIPEDTTTIMDLIRKSPDHQGLEAALDDSGLSAILEGDGPYTVFAPTDAALAKVPSATLLALLSDPTGALADVLLHHIVNGDYLRADFGPDQKVRTLLGDSLQVTNTMDSFLVDGVLITVSDVVATNGVVQVIDAVLLPVMVEDTFTILDAVKASPVHKTLDSLLQLSGLDVQLDGVGPYTLFAPTDEAFAALPTAVMDSLAADPQGLLRDVLLYHILGGEFRTGSLMDGTSEMTLEGQDVNFTVNTQGLKVNQASITFANILTDNGVVHVIDQVLLPEGTVAVHVIDAGQRGIRIFPNPVHDQVTITWPADWRNGAELRLYNQLGQQVGAWSGQTGAQQLPVTKLPAGSYLLRIRQGETTYQQRLLVTH